MKRLLGMVGACGFALASAVTPAAAQEVKLGVVMSNTGTYAFVGTAVINAVRLAFDEMQASNYFGSTKVSLMVEDNRSNTQEALALITRMATRDNAIMVIGPVATGEAMAAAPVANDLKMPIFTTATSPAVLKSGPWVFKVTETADQYMTVLGEHVAQRRKPKACFNITIRDNEGYILQANVFRDVVKKGGVAVVAEESILAADTDFTALGTKIANSKADCLFLSTPPEQGANIILQARQSGMPASTLLVGNTGMGSVNYVKAGGRAIEGTLFSAESVPSGVNDLARAFIKNYTSRYKVAPDSWAMVGYSMALIAGNAIKSAGANPTREGVRQAMLRTKGLPVVVGRGTWTIDPATRVPSFGYAVMKIQDGKFVEDK